MRMTTNRWLTVALVAGVGLASAACDDFMDVRVTDTISSETVNPLDDAATFSNSAWQNFQVFYSTMPVYAAWFTNELRVGDTFPTRNEYGRRDIVDDNGTAHTELWIPVQRAIASSEDALVLLDELPDSNINITRLYLTSAFASLIMAETYCTGVIRKGPGAPTPELNTAQMLDHAIERFGQAIASGQANGTATGTALANAARVGLARAHLFAGNTGQVAAAAGAVPADFVYNAVYVDDPGNRGRLGNTVFAFSGRQANRESGVVGPEWREIGLGEDVSTGQPFAGQQDGDARVSWRFEGRTSQDGVHEYVFQTRHDGWGAPLPVASGLEARYLIAEATGSMADRLALINERRAANGHDPFVSTDGDAVLEELLFQKGLDFWLTGRRMADWRRNPNHVRFILGPGDQYYKPDVGSMSNQTCFPLPWQEYSRNDDIPRS
jgi:starch-binding outer membrane protein, SusD/RagB family